MERTIKIKIKRIGQDEIDLVVDLFNKYRIFYKQPSNLVLAEEFLKERISKNESVIFLAYREEDNAIIPVGFTQLFPKISSVSAKKNWHIGDLYTESLYRKNGIGRELLQTAVTFAEKENAILVSLNTAKDNFTAQKVYDKFGFVKQEYLPQAFYYQFDIK